MGNIGATELILIILVALLLFGAGRVADIGKGLGEGIRNFKKGLKEDEAKGPGANKAAEPEAEAKDAKLTEAAKPAALPEKKPEEAASKAEQEEASADT